MQLIRRLRHYQKQSLLPALMLSALAAPLTSPTALALPDDQSQPISIDSDRVERNDKTGLTVYEGAVHIIQGTINIKADKVTLHTKQNKVNKIVCIGNPAHYQQLPELDGGLVIARASRIEYHLGKEVINLIKNASLDQEGSTLTGDFIDYDLKAELIEAHGDGSGSQRIHMVIPPNQQQTPKSSQQDKPAPKTTTKTQEKPPVTTPTGQDAS